MKSRRCRQSVRHKTMRTASRRNGSIMNVLAACICILTMTIIMMAFMGSAGLLNSKAAISQIARKYILRMETVGYLTGNDRLELSQELTEVGVVDLDLTGTTLNQVDYGSPILLVIHGKISGQMAVTGNGLFRTVFGETYYEFEERRMSTAKN